MEKEEYCKSFLQKHIHESAISQITYLETLSFPLTQKQRTVVEEFLELFAILDIDTPITKQAVKNRQTKKIKMADNLIAATAQVHDLALVTRNVKDFKSIAHLKIYNPFS
jgi:predicted nucleic acid-binding protein